MKITFRFENEDAAHPPRETSRAFPTEAARDHADAYFTLAWAHRRTEEKPGTPESLRPHSTRESAA